MQDVMWDMVRADQLLNDKGIGIDSSVNSAKERIKIYQQVFSIHNISKEKFRQSFSFYRTHPLLMRALLDSVNARAYSAPTQIVQPPKPPVIPVE